MVASSAISASHPVSECTLPSQCANVLNPADVRLCPILPLPTFQPFQGKRKVRRSGPETGRSTAENDPKRTVVEASELVHG
jgi:hypothetical protein